MHYYQHNIGDYRRDTSHLSLLEHGVYRQLMDMYYLSESPIPRETQLVFRRLSARTNDEQKAIEIILSEFFYLTDEGWSHKRCDSEIAVYRDKADTARANGKLGGRPKKTKEVILGNQDHNQNEPEPINQLTKEPINSLKEKIYKKEKTDSFPETHNDFNTFWNLYPKKTGKAEALKSWRKKKPDIDKVVSSLRWQVESQQWKQGFIPNPSTYINQERWDDEQSTHPVRQNYTKQELATIAARSIFGNETQERVIDGEVIEHGTIAKQLG